jgi:Second Messenger Oligonucleotide or Dinucleotide Synthetase domain
MTTAPALSFNHSFETQLDDLLMRICVGLQLEETRHERAEAKYHAVGRLIEVHPLIAMLNPSLHPQGSMALGTTVRPLIGDEYDLDFVCEFECDAQRFKRPVDALNLVEGALMESAVYRPMVTRKNRCIRLKYERDFHMDVLPACKDPQRGGTCVLVPDRKLEAWTPSNPKGYVAWFGQRARHRLARPLLGKAESIPDREDADEKAPLKLCVQLLKRWRDIRYKNNPRLAPISIVLTTLAAHCYRGEQSVALAMESILRDIAELANTSVPRLVVLNPSNPNEDLSERWSREAGTYNEFVAAMNDLRGQWHALLHTRGIDKVAKALERMFGEELTKQIIEKQARDVEGARARNQLGITRTSGIITGVSGSSVVPIRRNTFYGERS